MNGAVVVVTGAGSGVGRALALEAAGRGAAALALVDLDEAAAAAVADSIGDRARPVAYRGDVGDVDAVEDLAARVVADVGPPNLVCANAGVSPPTGRLLDTDPAVLRWVLEVNVVGTWATLRSFGRRLAVGPQPGRLLVTASEHALGVPFPGQGAYTASKHAILAMADVLRGELPSGVGISVLVPGLVASELWRGLERRPDRFGGPGAPDDLARLVIDRGMDPALLAAIALDGVERGDFVVASHHHARRYADERHRVVSAAFDRLDGDIGRSVSYAVEDVVASLAEGSGS